MCAWYNRADYIHDTIDSLLAQDYPNFDITVVNDGSPDPRVREILDSYDVPRLRVIHQENTGFTRAIRRAIDESDGEYISIQGAGDVSLPGRLSAQVCAFGSRESASIVGCWFVKEDMYQNKSTLYRPTGLSPGAIGLFAFSHGELMYLRSVYDKVGGYDETYDVGQGAPLWTSMLEFHEAAMVRKPLYVQRIFDDGVSRDEAVIQRRKKRDKERQFSEMKRRICVYYGRKVFSEACGNNAPSTLQNYWIAFLYFFIFGRMRLPIIRRIWLRFGYSRQISD